MKIYALAVTSLAALSWSQMSMAQDVAADKALEAGSDVPEAIINPPPPRFVREVASPPPPVPAPILSPVERARLRAPAALIADDAELLKRLENTGIIHRLRAIDVPFRLLAPEDGQPEASIWHKGPMPKQTLLARLRTQPIGEAAVTLTAKSGETVQLQLAEAAWRTTSDASAVYPLSGKLYCARDAQIGAATDANRPMDMCFADDDRDGMFDTFMTAEGDKGTVHSLYLVGPPLPLAAPLAYQVADSVTLGDTAEWHNCGKDWDLPYFRPYLIKGAVPIAAASTVNAQRQGIYCDKASAVETVTPSENGGRVANLGGLVFDIGKKSSGAKATVIELRKQDGFYREESGKVVPLSVGMTPTHVALATAQKFDQQSYQYNGQSTVKEGPFAEGEVFMTIGFKHGYTGTVTSDISIRTLLSKREVLAGTPVYGVPAEKRTVLIGAYGGETIMGPPIKREINTAIVWCLPNREEKEITTVERGVVQRSGTFEVLWSATCLPETSAGNHTVLEGQDPALAVRDMRMNASISTNDGPPPVKVTPSADFGGALTFRYSVTSATDRMITLKEEVMLGDEVTSDKVVLLLNLGAAGAPFSAAGGRYALKTNTTDSEKPTYTLESLQPMEMDANAAVQGIDIAALLRAMAARN